MPAMGGIPRPFPPVAVRLLALPVLAVSALLPWQAGWVCAVVAIVVLGVPHGALDVEVGRNLFRHRFGWAWFPAFSLPYLVLVGLVLVAWRTVPEWTLAAFLLASVWQFGTEDTDGGGLSALAIGGIPVAVPVLMQPAATAQVLSATSGIALAAPPAWLLCASLAWLPIAAVWAARSIAAGRTRTLALPAVLWAGFAWLPPMTAFAMYFVAVHAPAHTAALIRHPSRAPRVRDEASAWRLAAPTTALTILMGAALWIVSPGDPAARVVCATLQLLAALTLPHMLLDGWLAFHERSNGLSNDG